MARTALFYNPDERMRFRQPCIACTIIDPVRG
jgi:hypothetical protein